MELHDAVRQLDPYSDYVAWRAQHDPQADVYYRALADDIPDGRNPYRQAIDEEYSETTWVGLRTRESIQQLADDEGRSSVQFVLEAAFSL